MNSALCAGQVKQRRSSSRVHHLSYRLCKPDPDEIPTLFKPCWFWSSKSYNQGGSKRPDYPGASDMKIVHLEDIGPHYARTLFDRGKRFLERITEVEGYGPEFNRMGEYYLSYCEGGFRAHRLATVQLLLCKPQSIVPKLSQQLELTDGSLDKAAQTA